jgi:hypothetical protein
MKVAITATAEAYQHTEPESSTRRNRPWTRAELDRLHFFWGQHSLAEIAEKLQRTPFGVEKKARDIGLGVPRQGLMTLREFAKHSGFSTTKVKSAMRILGIRAMRRFTIYGGGPRRSRTYALTEDERERLLAHMLENPHAYRNLRGNGKTEGGVWGVGKKPHACLMCETYDRPHCAKGMCKACYSKKNR